MVQPHGVAVEEVVAGVDHLAGKRRDDRRAGGGGDVHAAVRIARLAIEHAAQSERTRASSRNRHAHLHVLRRLRGAEGRHDLRQMHALAFVARLVGRREIDRTGRDFQALLLVLLAGDEVVDLPLRLPRTAQCDVRRAGSCGKRNAHQRRPLDRIADHQQRHFAGKSSGPRGCRPERKTGDAAGDLCGLRPDGGGGRNALACGGAERDGGRADRAGCAEQDRTPAHRGEGERAGKIG